MTSSLMQKRRERREAESAADAGEKLAAGLTDGMFEDGVHKLSFPVVLACEPACLA